VAPHPESNRIFILFKSLDFLLPFLVSKYPIVIEDNSSILGLFLGLSKSAVEPKYSLTYISLFLTILLSDPTGIFHSSSDELSADSSSDLSAEASARGSPWSCNQVSNRARYALSSTVISSRFFFFFKIDLTRGFVS
jgi:hypothetical protein